MKWSLQMTLAVITTIFTVIAVLIVIIYSVVNWGQIGYTGASGIVGLIGPEGIIGPDVATIIRSCFQETSVSPFVAPAVAAGEFNTTDTILFDTTIIGQGHGVVAEIFVKIVNDNVDLDFDVLNTVKVTFPSNQISMATIRVYKGVSANVLNLAIVNTSDNVTSTVLDVTHAPTVTGANIRKSLWLSFKCDTAFKIFARTMQLPSDNGFVTVANKEARMEFL
jgi:hypothetical protein